MNGTWAKWNLERNYKPGYLNLSPCYLWLRFGLLDHHPGSRDRMMANFPWLRLTPQPPPPLPQTETICWWVDICIIYGISLQCWFEWTVFPALHPLFPPAQIGDPSHFTNEATEAPEGKGHCVPTRGQVHCNWLSCLYPIVSPPSWARFPELCSEFWNGTVVAKPAVCRKTVHCHLRLSGFSAVGHPKCSWENDDVIISMGGHKWPSHLTLWFVRDAHHNSIQPCPWCH